MKVAIGLYQGVTVLDAIGPYQVLNLVPGYEVVLCADRPGRVTDDRGLLHIDVEHGFEDVERPDLLVVPGGFGTRRLAATGGPIIDWVRDAHPHTTYTASVCTGALLLGAAGLLDGLPATTHWCFADHLARYGATYTEQRVVFNDRVVTAAGVSAGLDLALTLVGRLAGDEVAQAVQLGLEYDPQPPHDSGAPSKAPAPIRDLVAQMTARADAAYAAPPA